MEGLDRKRHEIRHDSISDCLLHLSVLYVYQLIIFNPNRTIYLCAQPSGNFMYIYAYTLLIFTHYYTCRVPLFCLTEKGGTRLLAVVNCVAPIFQGKDHSGPSPTWLSWGRLMHLPSVSPTDPDLTFRLRNAGWEQTIGWSYLQLQLHPWACPNFS